MIDIEALVARTFWTTPDTPLMRYVRERAGYTMNGTRYPANSLDKRDVRTHILALLEQEPAQFWRLLAEETQEEGAS